ncbi:hypothetical protein C8R45DRAFT_1179961 [Mycena sanguinolenta]|nr:hypothetical protein C8R45DRAFT_1179961 [Mycena sanguinolenta]
MLLLSLLELAAGWVNFGAGASESYGHEGYGRGRSRSKIWPTQLKIMISDGAEKLKEKFSPHDGQMTRKPAKFCASESLTQKCLQNEREKKIANEFSSSDEQPNVGIQRCELQTCGGNQKVLRGPESAGGSRGSFGANPCEELKTRWVELRTSKAQDAASTPSEKMKMSLRLRFVGLRLRDGSMNSERIFGGKLADHDPPASRHSLGRVPVPINGSPHVYDPMASKEICWSVQSWKLSQLENITNKYWYRIELTRCRRRRVVTTRERWGGKILFQAITSIGEPRGALVAVKPVESKKLHECRWQGALMAYIGKESTEAHRDVCATCIDFDLVLAIPPFALSALFLLTCVFSSPHYEAALEPPSPTYACLSPTLLSIRSLFPLVFLPAGTLTLVTMHPTLMHRHVIGLRAQPPPLAESTVSAMRCPQLCDGAGWKLRKALTLRLRFVAAATPDASSSTARSM